MTTLTAMLETLKNQYVELHTRKEDLFWSSKMGLGDDADVTQRAFSDAEIALRRFLQDAPRLRQLRDLESSAATSQDAAAARGWIAMFAANTIEDAAARKLSEEIIERESDLERKRGAMPLVFVDPTTQERIPMSGNRARLMLKNDPDSARRKAAHDTLRSIEHYVLECGFLDIVRMRNRLGRMLGFDDYYDWKVSITERMRKKRLFDVLDDLERRTRDRSKNDIELMVREHGERARDPWNFSFLRGGATSRAMDPYFGFGAALRRWAISFSALGVRFRDAHLTLDLVDRPGKFENGFMHGPGPAFFDAGVWQPARINFTANAVPGEVGSGYRATTTLFHEGGHAAHFSNILGNAPCFSQEFAPTSVAYAETQSMFMDSLLDDADWRARYATDKSGNPMPMELIEAAIRESQPRRAFDVRSMLVVPFGERRLYEIADDELSPERVLKDLRQIEETTLGLTSGVLPILSVPHLLSGEASAYFHGYVLAEMAVEQTRKFFLQRDGFLTDNPHIGPDMAEKYWKPGNAATFDETLVALTGGPLSADALVAACDSDLDEVIVSARKSVQRAAEMTRSESMELDVHVQVIHGREMVATTETGGIAAACEAFEQWAERNKV